MQTLNMPLEIKALNGREFSGYGSTFRNADLGGDIVMPGAFRRSLAEHRKAGTLPAMLWMHKMDHVPGVWTEMREDDKGLFVKGELVETQLGSEVRTLLQKKAVRGLSIGFRAVDVDFDDDGHRMLKQIDLWETSIVTLAMNPLANVEAVKSRLSLDGEYVPSVREFEKTLREAGYSRKTARAIVARVFDDDDRSCGTLETDRQWDAGVEDETADAMQAMKAADELMARICNGALKF